uniref:Uncharacterized protein n=1 Tax=Arundo donax TaxID=35708 RepID=A0A0A9FZN3_ARUDO
MLRTVSYGLIVPTYCGELCCTQPQLLLAWRVISFLFVKMLHHFVTICVQLEYNSRSND